MGYSASGVDKAIRPEHKIMTAEQNGPGVDGIVSLEHGDLKGVEHQWPAVRNCKTPGSHVEPSVE